jgi:6-aminohexanoate-oligomer endohydrolase
MKENNMNFKPFINFIILVISLNYIAIINAAVLTEFLSTTSKNLCRVAVRKIATSSRIVIDFEKKQKFLEFAWDAFKVGTAEYTESPTGCTVFAFNNRNVNAVVDIRGGSPATLFTDNLIREGLTELDAVVFAGGSNLGLEAAAGVANEIFHERNYSSDWNQIPLVTSAVIYDWAGRNGRLYPDKDLGAKAYKSALRGKFLLGAHGAGINATVAKSIGLEYASKGGQGAAFKKLKAIKVAAFTVVNALGAIYDPSGRMIYGYKDPSTGNILCRDRILRAIRQLTIDQKTIPFQGNTTLSLIVTNLELEIREMQLIARQIHNSIAEVIRPYGTPFDGDTLYFVSTKELKFNYLPRNNYFSIIGLLGSEAIKEAIYSSFLTIEPRKE